MYENVLQIIISIVEKVVDDESVEVTPQSNFMDDLWLASLDLLCLLSDVENEFGFEISDNLLRKIVTVEDMAKIVYEIQKENN